MDVKTSVERFSLRLNEIKDIKNIKIIEAGTSSVSYMGLFNKFFILSIAGGWLIGIFSTFAGGCVLRQHVLCAQVAETHYFTCSDSTWLSLYITAFYSGILSGFTDTMIKQSPAVQVIFSVPIKV